MKPKFKSLIAAFAPLSRSSLIFCASLCAATSAHADQTWTGDSLDGLWTSTGNWSGAALPTAADAVVFAASSDTNLTIDTGAAQSIYGISLGSPAGPVTLNNNTLTIGKGGVNMASATQDFTLASAVTPAPAVSQVWSVATGRLLTVSGVLAAANNNSAVRLDTSAGGTINVSSGTASTMLGRFATFGQSDLAGLNALKNVVAGSTVIAYSPNPNTGVALPTMGNATYTVIDSVNSNTSNPSAFRMGGTAINASTGVRFNTAHATGLAWSVDLSSSRNLAMHADTAILVSPIVNTDVVFGGSGTVRTFGSGEHKLHFANFSANNLIFNCGFSVSAGRSWRFTKSGSGKLIIAGQADTVNGGISINEGTVQIGNAGATGTINGTGAYTIAAGAALDFNRSDAALSVANAITGAGVVNHIGAGEVALTATNSYTGGTNILSGAIAASAATNFGTGVININGGGVKFAGVFDLTASAVMIGSSGATFNTNGNAITLANAFNTGSTGGVTKTGAGSLTLSANNDYSGTTAINGGTLLANASTSSTGSGSVLVNSGATLGGTGSISGAVSVTSGAILAPGASVGTLTVGSLNLNAGSLATYEFEATAAPDDRVSVSTSGGLTISGGAITLYQEGTTIPFTTPGTYNLISYTGAITGSVSSLSIANQQAGFSYNIAATGSNVTLTIATSGVVAQWNTNGGGSWNETAKWTPNTLPVGVGATANFSTVLSAPASVTLDESKTVGAITFLSGANGYTIAPGTGGTITLNNGANPAAIVNNDGNHEISALLSLTSNTNLSSLAADDGLILSGVISGAGTLTKTGPGNLSLLGANSFNGLLTLNGGATTFVLNGLGAGNLTISGASLIWDSVTSNTQDISNRTITFGSDPVVFDTNGNDVALANSIGNGGTAAFTKAGLGKLTLGANATFTGVVTISAGILQLGTGGATGLVSGNITNNAALIVNLSTGSTLSNLVSGTGTFVHSGTGSLDLTASNTFSGTSTISSATGTLILGIGGALQNSTLNYGASGGTLSFGTNLAATLGGLAGDKALILENTTPAPVVLSIGNNNQATSYSGALSGTGSLTKIGTGISTLTGASTYAGDTLVSAGILDLAGGTINGAALTVNGTGRMVVSGGALAATTGALAVSSGGMRLDNGSALFTGALVANCTSSNGNAALIKVTNGTLTTPSITLGRTGQNASAEPTEAAADVNLYITGGAVNVATTLRLGTADGNSNSTVSTRIDGGTLTVGGAITVGLNNGGRWSILDVNGGELSSTDIVSGIVLGGPNVGKSAFFVRLGTATAERIQLGQGVLGGGALVKVSGGELYVGAGGIVLGTTEPLFAPEIRLAGGILAAKAAWSTSLPVNITVTSTIKAADAADTAKDITLSGIVSGTGSLEKTGSGALTLSGLNTHTGNTTVFAGSLVVTNDDVFDNASTVTIASGATLNLTHSGTDIVGTLVVDDVTLPDGVYTFGTGKLQVGTSSPFQTWATLKGLDGTAGKESGLSDDPDNDGKTNLSEFAFNGNPLSGSDNGQIYSLTVDSNFDVDTTKELILTIAVRAGAPAFVGSPSPSSTVDGVTYAIQGSNDLSSFTTTVNVVPTPVTAGLPAVGSGYEFRSFSLSGSNGLTGNGFLRANVVSP